MKLYRSFIFLITIFILYSCAGTQTYIGQTEIDEGTYELKNLMVLHLGGIYDNRKVIESEITYWLNHYGYDAYPAYRYTAGETLPGRPELLRIIEENQFEAILITELMDIDTRERFENPQQKYGTSPNDPIFYNYVDSYRNQYSTGYSFLEKSYIVDSELYVVDGSKLIFKSITETTETNPQDRAIEDFSKSISKSLAKSNLLKKKD